MKMHIGKEKDMFLDGLSSKAFAMASKHKFSFTWCCQQIFQRPTLYELLNWYGEDSLRFGSKATGEVAWHVKANYDDDERFIVSRRFP